MKVAHLGHRSIDEKTHMKWLRGPMARRLTTNQEIAGSIPAVTFRFISFVILLVRLRPRTAPQNQVKKRFRICCISHPNIS